MGNLSTTLHPFEIALVSFAFVQLIFCLFEWKFLVSCKDVILKNLSSVLLLNLTTAVAWVGLFYALKFIEPAINTAITFGTGPLLTLVFVKMFRKNSVTFASDFLCAFGVFFSFCWFVWSTTGGHSAVGSLESKELLLGLGASFSSGLASAGNLVFSKRLYDANFKEGQVMAIRFWGLIVVAAVFAFGFLTHRTVLDNHLLNLAAIGVFGIALPLYLLQVGIRNTEPIEVSLLLPFLPLVVMLFQLADTRLVFSWQSLVGALLFGLFSVLGVYLRPKKEPA